mmetsp:Transcript_44252/g.51144  ORF Transcript_44252/g.51144 Transcript_44252/m.51144 type:complete len:115 (-) Transcript_44252:230-574(-)
MQSRVPSDKRLNIRPVYIPPCAVTNDFGEGAAVKDDNAAAPLLARLAPLPDNTAELDVEMVWTKSTTLRGWVGWRRSNSRIPLCDDAATRIDAADGLSSKRFTDRMGSATLFPR